MTTPCLVLVLSKKEILEELKKAEYNDVEDMVYRFQLTYAEVIDMLDLKYFPTKKNGRFLKPRYLWSGWFKQLFKKLFTR